MEWYGFFLPGQAAPELVQRTATLIRGAMTAPEMAEGLAAFGLEVAPTTPAELARAIQDEHRAWAPIVKRIGFTPES